jgi:hypothetical protein
MTGDFVANSPFYAVDMKVQLTQTTIKYFIITDAQVVAGETFLTLDGQGKYTLANAAITSHLVTTWSTPTAGFPLADPLYSAADHNHDSDYAALDHVHDLGGWIAAGETWTYASANGATATVTIPGDKTTKYSKGMKVKVTQTTEKYFWLNKAPSYSSGSGLTTLTLWGGTDYTLASAAITSPCYSMTKSPFGFPVELSKWTVKVTDTSARAKSSPAINTVYYSDLGSIHIIIPPGDWRLSVQFVDFCAEESTRAYYISALSTSNSSISDNELASVAWGWYSDERHVHLRKDDLSLATETTYYLIMKALIADMDSIGLQNDLSTLVIRAECAYL